MKRILILLATAALAIPTAASAKGPAGASIDGPGTGGGINLSGGGENFGTPLGDLTQYAGFFPAMFGQTPDPMQKSRPKGDLGPKYTVTYSVPNGSGTADRLVQDLYPYANPPVTYTEPGQKFFDGQETHGGWFMSTPALKERLIEAGLPRSAPSGSGSDGGFFSVGLLGLFGAALVLATATTFVLRRRARPAPAA